MQTAVVNVKVDPKTKKQAQKVAEELGLTLSSVINGFLKQFVRTKSVNFSVSEELSDWAIKNLEASRRDVKAGRVISFKNADDAIKYVDQLIENDKRLPKNQLVKKISQTTSEITSVDQDSL